MRIPSKVVMGFRVVGNRKGIHGFYALSELGMLKNIKRRREFRVVRAIHDKKGNIVVIGGYLGMMRFAFFNRCFFHFLGMACRC